MKIEAMVCSVAAMELRTYKYKFGIGSKYLYFLGILELGSRDGGFIYIASCMDDTFWMNNANQIQ